jgi:hypothetical protein
MGFGHCPRKLEFWMVNKFFWSLAINLEMRHAICFWKALIKLYMGQLKATKIIIANDQKLQLLPIKKRFQSPNN